MIKSISIRNYKSVSELDIELGRVNVFIGANGCGKSNILEAIALASAASTRKLDNEFLGSRGIRVPEHPRTMRSAFVEKAMDENIVVTISGESSESPSAKSEKSQVTLEFSLSNDNISPYSKWSDIGKISIGKMSDVGKSILKLMSDNATPIDLEEMTSTIRAIESYQAAAWGLADFIIYSPEHSALRTFDIEGQIQPLGVRGEGLFRLLTVMASQIDGTELSAINGEMRLLDWFDSFDIPENPLFTERNLLIHDRYLQSALESFTQRVANEGFLYLLFYFTLLISSETPKFFAVDNVDVSLNPRLCQELIRRINKLAVERDKQMILTTHSPSVLDGIDLRDDEQRLFVVFRNSEGHTRCRRIEHKEPVPDQEPVRLSEAFLRGYLGGLPKGF